MTDEEFENELDALIRMLRNLHRIRDRSLTKWIKREIRAQLLRIINQH